MASWAGAFDAGGAKPMPEGFAYRSDSNDQWLDADALRLLIDRL